VARTFRKTVGGVGERVVAAFDPLADRMYEAHNGFPIFEAMADDIANGNQAQDAEIKCKTTQENLVIF
jgi:hypothetical protein